MIQPALLDHQSSFVPKAGWLASACGELKLNIDVAFKDSTM